MGEMFGQYEIVFIGDVWVRESQLQDADGNEIPYSTQEIDFVLYDSAGTILLTKSIGTGITIIDPTHGWIRIKLTGAETADLNGKMLWRLNYTELGDQSTMATGILEAKNPLDDAPILNFINTNSPYVVSDTDGSTFTYDEFYSVMPKAESILAIDDPGLSDELYDYALSLMILHLHELRLGNTGMVQESIGDYSYSRAKANMTGWLVQYENLIMKVGSDVGTKIIETQASERGDSSMTDFELDQSDINTYYGD